MTRHLILESPAIVPPEPSVIAIDRAIADLRRGLVVVISDQDGVVLACRAAEALMSDDDLTAKGALAMTRRRALALGLIQDPQSLSDPLMLAGIKSLTVLQDLIDPTQKTVLPSGLGFTDSSSLCHAAAIQLAKLARLLPVVWVQEIDPTDLGTSAVLSAADILDYQRVAAQSLQIVSHARVPLAEAEHARIVAFRPSDGGVEHLAIVIGEPDLDQPVLTRLHSECFTGDLLASLRCDCGDQLRGAIAEMAKTGSGILLYLAQEGRGIGLVNKLHAYRLQDSGLDTVDANNHLGFDDDERLYLPAAVMLRELGIGRIRLMTNNPAKVEALARHGVEIVERVPHSFPSNSHNRAYLHAKAQRAGHLL